MKDTGLGDDHIIWKYKRFGREKTTDLKLIYKKLKKNCLMLHLHLRQNRVVFKNYFRLNVKLHIEKLSKTLKFRKLSSFVLSVNVALDFLL